VSSKLLKVSRNKVVFAGIKLLHLQAVVCCKPEASAMVTEISGVSADTYTGGTGTGPGTSSSEKAGDIETGICGTGNKLDTEL
jgi:hypothetical protein